MKILLVIFVIGVTIIAETHATVQNFTCRIGIVIPNRFRCDGIIDCPVGGDDEVDCNDYPCAGGLPIYIPMLKRCDYYIDCEFGDDERNCDMSLQYRCGFNGFPCKNGTCIGQNRVCDYYNDCGDDSDEIGCVYPTIIKALGPPVSNTFRCANNVTINISLRCNKIVDCSDGSDEANCLKFTDVVRCRNGKRLTLSTRCNGADDCGDGTDEENCTGVAALQATTTRRTPNRPLTGRPFTCKDGEVLPDVAYTCDGTADCADRTDETAEMCR